MPHLKTHSYFTKLIALKGDVCSDWPAFQCVVIGLIPQACDGNVTLLTIFRNTVSPQHGGSGNNTTVRIKVTPSFFAEVFGQCYANLPTP